MNILIFIILIIVSKDINVGYRDIRSVVLVRLKFHASMKQKSEVVTQKLLDQNSLMTIFDTSLSTHFIPVSADVIIPVNRYLMRVSVMITLQ